MSLSVLMSAPLYTNEIIVGASFTSAASFVVSPSTLVFIAGGIAIANAPYSAFKEMKMSKIPTLRSMNNALREDANRLGEIVSILLFIASVLVLIH